MATSPDLALTQHRIEYLDQAATSDPGRDYKAKLLTRLELRPGLTVLDVGCGPGTDLPAMAKAVGDSGLVVGIDNDPAMVTEAKTRLARHGRVQVSSGDAHALPLADHSVDRARTDRVLQHVAQPQVVLAELRRVIRPGGGVVLADPDWDTLVVDDSDVAMSRSYCRFVAEQVVRNGVIGRQLARLASEAGFTVSNVDALPIVFRDFEAANQILRLPNVVGRAVQARAMPPDAAQLWLERLSHSPFLAMFTLVMVTAHAV